jgi:hypothetical protein
MPPPGLQIKGYRELMRGLKQLTPDSKREIRKAFKHSGEAVQHKALVRFQPIDARTAAHYKVGVTQRGVRVYQSLRKTTGKHPEYGALQMRRALIPARAEELPETERGVEHALDVVAAEFNRGSP